MKNIFGDNLKNLRKEFGYSQSDLATKLAEEGLELSYKAISKWEQGTGYPEIPTLVLLAEILGTTVDYLLTGKDPVAEQKREIKKQRGLQEFSDKQIKAIIDGNKLDLHIFNFEEYGRVYVNFYEPALVQPKLILAYPVGRSDIEIQMPEHTAYFDLVLWFKNPSNMNVRTKNYYISE
jgi:transcriptional regulator with XRE-family HTH domain